MDDVKNMAEVQQVQGRFDRAELAADLDTLTELIAEDFLSIGPKGFVMDKAEWIARHVHFDYHALDIRETDVRGYGDTVIVRNVQRNRAQWRDEQVQVNTRVTQVWVRQPLGWRLASIQFSPLDEA